MSIVRYLQNVSVKQKIVGSIVTLLSLVGLFVFVYFPASESASVNKYLRASATGLADISANGAVNSLVFFDVEAAKRVLGSTQGVRNVAFSAVLTPDGKIFAGVGDDKGKPQIEKALTLTGEKQTVLFELEGMCVAVSPIVSAGGSRLGTLVLGIDQSEMSSDVAGSRWSAFVVTIVIIATGSIFGLFIARIIARPIREVVMSIDNADLTMRFNTARKDEIGDLQRSFDKFVASMTQTLQQVAEASTAVASSTGEISASTEQMAAGAHEQSSQAGEVASAVEQMTKTIAENSRNASETSQTAKKAKEAAEEGGKIVDETVVGMRRIAEVVHTSAATVKALGRSSDQIGEIIGVIDDIADQTNLLALNAAIEAARAGEQGRGFAVVADEVRKLAERTTKATKEIAGMIKSIQSDTTGAVSSMDRGTKEVEEGIKLVDKAGASLRDIVVLSQQVTDMIVQIAAASEQQSSASEQIGKNVVAISMVTSQTAEGTQQIARTAEELTRLTDHLQQVVGQFKLSTDVTDAGRPAPSRDKGRSHRSASAARDNGVRTAFGK